MRESGLRAWYRKPYTQTTVDSDFSTQLKNILKRDFSPKNQMQCGVVISPIPGQNMDLYIR